MNTARAPGDSFAAASSIDCGDERPVVIRLDRRAVFLHFGLEARQPPRLPERVERAVHRDPVRPGAELRVAPVARQRAEDLNPDFLRDVRGHVRVSAHQATHDHVDVRSVPGPEGPERPLIAIDARGG